jgi:hypothetical protein
VATYHPSAILRAPDATRAAELRAMLVADLAIAAASVGPTNERPSEEGLSHE